MKKQLTFLLLNLCFLIFNLRAAPGSGVMVGAGHPIDIAAIFEKDYPGHAMDDLGVPVFGYAYSPNQAVLERLNEAALLAPGQIEVAPGEKHQYSLKALSEVVEDFPGETILWKSFDD